MINKMVVKNWELQQNDSGEFRVNLNLVYAQNQFGGEHGVEKMFRNNIRDADGYYNGGSESFISTKFASSRETLSSIKEILRIIHLFNVWVHNENCTRSINEGALHEKIAKQLYPIPEIKKEG